MRTYPQKLAPLAALLGALTVSLAQTTVVPPLIGPPIPAWLVSSPKIQFETTTYDFGKTKSGDLVKHNFIFTNAGVATLVILNVKPGCGCTTAGAWDKEVEPGKTGIIPLQFNSAGFDGRVGKSTTVTSNDPERPTTVISIAGEVWKPVHVSPKTVMFTYSDEDQTNQTQTVNITSSLDEDLGLLTPEGTNSSFQAELKTIQPGKEFELRITAVPPFTELTTRGSIWLKTSSKEMPTINVSTYVTVQPTVFASPSRVSLPPGPLTTAFTPAVTIRNNGKEPLALSEPSVNLPDIKVALREIQAGRIFGLTLTVPAGFQMEPDQKVELTVKSNHPRFPLITVPVLQSQVRRASSPAQPTAVRVTPVSKTTPTPADKP